MSHFVINRKALFTFATAFAILGSSFAYVPSTAQAADDWGEILKPLVKDVLVPGVKLGVKKWTDRKSGKKDSEQSGEFVSGDVPPPPDWGDAPPPPVESVNVIEDGSTVSGEDGTVPTPEEPMSSEPNDPVQSASEPPPPESPSDEIPPPPPPPPEA